MKIRLIVLLGMAFLLCRPAVAQNNEEQRLSKTLSDQYGAEVKVSINGAECKIKYPKVDIENEEMEYIPSPTDPNEITVKPKKVITTIPATTPVCEQTESFYGLPQYKISNDSPSRFLAQIYNLSTIDLADGFTAQKYKEEMLVVPKLGLISSDKLQIKNAAYTEKDATTGLKTEIGNLKNFIMEQKITKDKDILKYKLDTQLSELNIALPFFSVQIPSERQSSELEYKLTSEDFDFSQLLQNLELLQSSKSAAFGKGIKINVDFAGAGLIFDFSTQGDVQQRKAGYLDFVGDFKLKNMSFIGDFIEASKQPKSIEMTYKMADLDAKNASQFAKIQQDMQAAGPAAKPNEKEMADMLDALLDKAKMNFDIRFNFTNADIYGQFNFERKNGYLFGTGKLAVNNLYNIFPEQQQCLNNPQQDSIPACSDDNFAILSGFADYIDITKNSSESVYTFNDKGIFKGEEKIGEPIELNFKKMMQESEEAQQKIDAEDEAFQEQMKATITE